MVTSDPSPPGTGVPAVLVTGASGFIGTHLVARLLRDGGLGVRALVRPHSPNAARLRNLKVDIVEGDLADPAALQAAARGVRCIYHLGGATSRSWEDNYRSTIQGTTNVVRAALAHGVERCVYVSSLSVYDVLALPEEAVIDEDVPYQKELAWVGPYAACKIQAERLVLEAYRQHGLRVTVVRPGIVFGPLGWLFFPHLGYRYQDTFFIVGKGDTVLPLTYVENTVDGFIKAATHERAVGRCYNLVDDGAITVRDYLDRFTRLTGRPARIIHLPYLLPYLAATAFEMLHHVGVVKNKVTSRDQLRWKQKRVWYDNTRAKEELGWQTDVPLDEGLRRTFGWYMAGQAQAVQLPSPQHPLGEEV